MNSKIFNRPTTFVLCSLFLALPLLAQDIQTSTQNDTVQTDFSSRKKTVSFVIGAHTVLTTILVYEWWWKGDYHPFAFGKEGFFDDYSLGVDKTGHFMTSYFYSRSLQHIFAWAGYDKETIRLWSAVIPWFYALSFEIGDGFSHYTFSTEDLAANTLGVGYAYLQMEYPFLENFIFKWSYYPSGKKYPDGWELTRDYDGHLYWLAVNVHNVLPKDMQQYWPGFLNIAVGYGVKNFDGYTSVRTDNLLRKFTIALDFNLTSIPTSSDTWESLLKIGNYLHLPLPGVKTTQNEGTEFKPLLVN